jgi:hypothetical protein
MIAAPIPGNKLSGPRIQGIRAALLGMAADGMVVAGMVAGTVACTVAVGTAVGDGDAAVGGPRMVRGFVARKSIIAIALALAMVPAGAYAQTYEQDQDCRKG